jgi:hypothetical protein
LASKIGNSTHALWVEIDGWLVTSDAL